jgi:hypothetical protein
MNIFLSHMIGWPNYYLSQDDQSGIISRILAKISIVHICDELYIVSVPKTMQMWKNILMGNKDIYISCVMKFKLIF